MASLEDIGAVPGGGTIRQFLEVSHNDDGTIKGGTGGSKTVTQTAHGFTLGTPTAVRRQSGSFVASKADAPANADVDGLAVAADVNTFTLYEPGSDVSGFATLTDGQDYFLDPVTAGALTTTEPSAAGQVSVPVVKALSATEAIFAPKRGLVIPAGAITVIPVKLVDDGTAITVGEGKFAFTVPASLNGKSLVLPSGTSPGIGATCSAAPSGSALSFGIRKNAATEMLSTNITIDTTKTTSDQSATQPVVKSDGSQTVATGDVVWIDCDQADSGSTSHGAIVYLAFA